MDQPIRIANMPKLEESWGYDRSAHRLHPARGGARACTKSAAWAPSGTLPHFDDLVFLGASLSRYPLEGYREKCDTKTVLGHAVREASRSSSRFPITIAGMSFGALSANVKEALGRAATAMGTSTTTGDGGMTPEERAVVEDARLPVPAVALRIQSRRRAPGRRHRDRHRPGREARRRRHAAGAEDQSARGEDAHAARGHRPALGLPASRLDRPRRSGDQDPASCARSPTGRSRST